MADLGLAGNALIDLSRYDEAQQALTHVLDVCPKDRRHIPLTTMGHLHDARGDFERAAGWYKSAIESQPGHTSGYIYLGGALARLGASLEAEESTGMRPRLVSKVASMKPS